MHDWQGPARALAAGMPAACALLSSSGLPPSAPTLSGSDWISATSLAAARGAFGRALGAALTLGALGAAALAVTTAASKASREATATSPTRASTRSKAPLWQQSCGRGRGEGVHQVQGTPVAAKLWACAGCRHPPGPRHPCPMPGPAFSNTDASGMHACTTRARSPPANPTTAPLALPPAGVCHSRHLDQRALHAARDIGRRRYQRHLLQQQRGCQLLWGSVHAQAGLQQLQAQADVLRVAGGGHAPAL